MVTVQLRIKVVVSGLHRGCVGLCKPLWNGGCIGVVHSPLLKGRLRGSCAQHPLNLGLCSSCAHSPLKWGFMVVVCDSPSEMGVVTGSFPVPLKLG